MRALSMPRPGFRLRRHSVEAKSLLPTDYALWCRCARSTPDPTAGIDDPCYRRGILTQLNRGEGRHRLARKCFHGQRGELRQRYREGQEDQLGALDLVVNALVLWNTRYMDAALSQLRSQGEVKPEDVALSR